LIDFGFAGVQIGRADHPVKQLNKLLLFI